MSNPEFCNLLFDHFKPIRQDLLEWTQEPYEQNELYSEKLIHKVCAGLKVRSKAEAMIATSLHKHKIPFRYECKLQLGEQIFYPDFTIRHPDTGEYYYWEHLGLISDLSYCQKAFSKIQTYILHDISPAHNLILTFEDKDHPLDAELIEKIIARYFL